MRFTSSIKKTSSLVLGDMGSSTYCFIVMGMTKKLRIKTESVCMFKVIVSSRESQVSREVY